MASRSAIAARLNRALEEIRSTLAKHDAESAERLRNAVADGTIAAGAVPSLKQEDMVLCYLAESVATLVKLVDRELTPRRRGRPRKNA